MIQKNKNRYCNDAKTMKSWIAIYDNPYRENTDRNNCPSEKPCKECIVEPRIASTLGCL